MEKKKKRCPAGRIWACKVSVAARGGIAYVIIHLYISSCIRGGYELLYKRDVYRDDIIFFYIYFFRTHVGSTPN